MFRKQPTPAAVEAQPQRIYSAREAAKLFSVSLATWNRYVAADLVPRPIQLGPRRVGWLEGELAAAQHMRRNQGTSAFAADADRNDGNLGRRYAGSMQLEAGFLRMCALVHSN